ncbi:methyltransferase domain-containing protein [Tropicibacter naphthalenivorans]|uniref:Trans-aconitate 2-methyltransferase n=1 Tax=Tropicibacter naphthalenivorans TaxID=441103 RepID=A0A0N7LZN8_9RHOB|nr:methyltransferase domain-containing protein [Tropicibacter naphthalenivorans]CUH78185.1 Trans-aconitate 2-methyltransferase [Tropicibacter naphthalenivorans]SMC78206.1 trans-aconitate 2-methyltransferase [Tropicibacter naphthalenivorans]
MDWNPRDYARFAGVRLRPALDLLMQVGPLPEGDVVDLGCGNGAVGPALRQRFGDRRIIGVDSSAAMLQEAAQTDAYDALHPQDISDWTGPAALIFSNAALHWLPDHAALLPRLVAGLEPGGTLAIQVPHQNNAPSHRLWRQLAEELFPGRVDHDHGPGILLPAAYFHLLEGLGDLRIWETEYYQVLDRVDAGHPVRRFTESTYARPVLEKLDAAEQARLIALYEEAIAKVYPAGPDGRVLFPFRRLFITLKVA